MMGYYIWLHSNPKLVEELRRENEARAAAYMAFIRRISTAVSGIASAVIRAASRLRENTGRGGDQALSGKEGSRQDIGAVRRPPALFEAATALEIRALKPRHRTENGVERYGVRKAA